MKTETLQPVENKKEEENKENTEEEQAIEIDSNVTVS